VTRVSKNIIIGVALVLAVGLISNQSVMNTFAISYGGNQYSSTQYKTNPTATANVNNNQPKSTLKSESQSATVDTSSTVIKKFSHGENVKIGNVKIDSPNQVSIELGHINSNKGTKQIIVEVIKSNGNDQNVGSKLIDNNFKDSNIVKINLIKDAIQNDNEGSNSVRVSVLPVT
jgi:hypothetical protein